MLKITLRAARVSCGYTVAEAAKKSGLDPRTIFKNEEDSSRITWDTAEKLCDLYDVSPDIIFWGPESNCSKHNRMLAQERREIDRSCLLPPNVNERDHSIALLDGAAVNL